MSDFEVEVEGFRRVLESLEDIQDDIRGAGTVTIGTGVEYAVYLEFGTSDMDPKPFFRPALAELRVQGVERFLRSNTNLSAEQIDELETLVDAVGLALERRIKEIITKKSLIDTGTLRASILAIPGDDASKLPGEDAFSGFDADSPAPASAGRAVASETVEIDL
jgi:hypothetical protein